MTIDRVWSKPQILAAKRARQFPWLPTATRLTSRINTRMGISRAHAFDVVEQGSTYAMPHA